MADKVKCYTSKAARFRITMKHIQRKVSDTGISRIVDQGRDLCFRDHQFSTSDPKEQAFLENCKSYKNGNVFLPAGVPAKLQSLIDDDKGPTVVSSISNTETVKGKKTAKLPKAKPSAKKKK